LSLNVSRRSWNPGRMPRGADKDIKNVKGCPDGPPLF
jgi:hypothetical protein